MRRLGWVATALLLWALVGPDAHGRTAAELLLEADTMLLDGQFRDAEARLRTARSIASPSEAVRADAIAADIAIAIGRAGQAQRLASSALAAAPAALDPAVRVRLIGTIGISLALQGDEAAALRHLQEAAAAARQADLPLDTARALTNAARLAVEAGLPERARKLLADAEAIMPRLPAARSKAQLLLAAGRVHATLDASRRARRSAHALYLDGQGVARQVGDRRLQSYAMGYSAELYEAEQRFDDALTLFRRAAFLAQQADADAALYQWEWGSGRVLEAQGRAAEARSSYQRAVDRLEALRHQLPYFYGQRGAEFERTVEPVYLALVGSHLDEARRVAGADRQAALLAARNTMELLKVAELRNYFGDDCVERNAERAAVDALSASALVVYPIPLPDRLELLVTLPDGRLQSYRADVTAAALTADLARWRALLEKRITREYLTLSQSLYGHLVAAFESLLAPPVETLVFVPHGALGMVPVAALHDGERFLIERVAVAVTPGLELISPAPLDAGRLTLLLAGLTRGREGYPQLSHVATELGNVADVGTSETLLDESFRRPQLERALASEAFNVVHIATHGEFGGDSESSFLLTDDGRLGMDELEDYVGLFRYRQQPLELLTLSACETAAGNHRAAMGLSGIAVKAGARSAVGTLWRVNDQSSALLMQRFYAGLAQPGTSRAEALRQAQLALVQDLRYWHPGYWSAFLLISNWL